MWQVGKSIIVGCVMLALAGCLTVPDTNNPGQYSVVPDYELIELTSYAAYTALLSHKKMPGTEAKEALAVITDIESYLVPLSADGQPLTLGALRLIVRQKAPTAYAPLSELALVLVQRALSRYEAPVNDPLLKSTIIASVMKSVLGGAKMAIQPYVVNPELAWEPGETAYFAASEFVHP